MGYPFLLWGEMGNGIWFKGGGVKYDFGKKICFD
jgi:hypothetical protein